MAFYLEFSSKIADTAALSQIFLVLFCFSKCLRSIVQMTDQVLTAFRSPGRVRGSDLRLELIWSAEFVEGARVSYLHSVSADGGGRGTLSSPRDRRGD